MTERTLRTARLAMRTWRDEDAARLAELHASPEMMRFLGGPMSRADCDAMLARMRAHWEARELGAWALTLRDTGELVGLAGIVVPRFETRFTPCVEILWRLAPAQWGRGLVTEAARAALDDGFDRLAFDEVLAFTVAQNERSWRVMDRLGMTRDPADDFDHPLVEEGSPLKRHMVYRVARAAWIASRASRASRE